MNIYPSILSDSIKTAQKQIMLIKNIPEVNTVQIDIVDGIFADNLTISVFDLVNLDFGELAADIHLMTEEPMDFVWELESIRDDIPIRTVIAQVERMSYQQDFIDEVKSQGWLVGLSLDLFTPLEAIDQEKLDQLDMLQLMGVEAGFQNQDFNPVIFEKVKEVKKLCPKLEITIDGGVKLENVKQITNADVGSAVVGSALWQASDIKSVIKKMVSS